MKKRKSHKGDRFRPLFKMEYEDTGKRDSTTKKMLITIVLAFAIISFWRGAWGLMDLYLFPRNSLLSFMISLLLGLAILYYTEAIFDSLV